MTNPIASDECQVYTNLPQAVAKIPQGQDFESMAKIKDPTEGEYYLKVTPGRDKGAFR